MIVGSSVCSSFTWVVLPSFFSDMLGEGIELADFISTADFDSPFVPPFEKKLAILDLFWLLERGMMKVSELLPTFPTSFETGYISSSPLNGFRRL